MRPMPCDLCGRSFGGTFAYERHLDRRRDRCRNVYELRQRGLELLDGVWRRRPPFPSQPQLEGMPRRGAVIAQDSGKRLDGSEEPPHPKRRSHARRARFNGSSEHLPEVSA